MQKILLSSVFTLLLCYGKAQNGSELAKLRELNARFIHNFVTNDTASHNRIIHPKFVCITSDGKYLNRVNYLNGWAHGFDGFKYWDYRDENIELFDNVALVHSKNKYVVQRDGKEFTSMSMYTDVYIKENGEWKCIQARR